MASPRQVAELCRVFLDGYPDVPLTLHFHNTRGMGLANVVAALEAGVNSFDASLGGQEHRPAYQTGSEHLI
jgi:hydroxymethylglutaryl-CoA lyase